MPRRILALIMIIAAAAGAMPTAAQTVVNSETIDAVSVTLYRDPQPDQGWRRQQASWPGGYALITETRTIRVPAGRAVIRLQGVAQGILPETAIVTGLPKQVSEKNRDALLLSPAGLVDAYIKRSVTLRRTDRATGKVEIEDAVIEAGPGGGVVLTTADGVQVLGCSGLPESIAYAAVPDGLFARPTLSVVTDSPSVATVQIQLSYLAEGFDWSANYVARVADDGATLDLFAWLTVKNGGSEGFANAHTQAVAGGLNKEGAAEQPEAPTPELHLSCWPMDVTSTHPLSRFERLPWPGSSPRGRLNGKDYGADIVVTAQRRSESMQSVPMAISVMSAPAMVAQQEELGDLKLYRIPEPVTVAAQSTKQVAMINRKKVPFARIYTGQSFNGTNGSIPAGVLLRTENRDSSELGLPLPAGGVAVFQDSAALSLLVAEGRLDDRAVGDDVEFGAGQSSDVRYEVIPAPTKGKYHPFAVRITNARPEPAMFELNVPNAVYKTSDRIRTYKGRKIWRVTVPANGEAKLEFSTKDG